MTRARLFSVALFLTPLAASAHPGAPGHMHGEVLLPFLAATAFAFFGLTKRAFSARR